MSRPLLISERAEADLLEIWLWTFDRFGKEQADRYLDLLDACMRSCGAEPQGGHDRSAVRRGYWSRSVGKHIVFYTVTPAGVVVRRVLHASMDLGAHLQD